MQKAEILPTVVQRNSLPDASREPGVTTPTAGVEVNASPAVATLEVTALGMMGAACTTNGTPTPDGAPTMAPTAAATQAATPEGKPTVVVTSEATSTARIEITQTPEPSNKPSMFEGLNFGVYGADQKTVGAVQGNAVEKALQAKQMGDYVVPVVSGAHETRVNTLYNPDFPDSPAGFSLDQTYLNTLFQANADKSGIVHGTLPNGQPVEQKGALWTTTVDGHEVVFNPVVISREGKQFGYPVLVEKGADKALYLVLVDEKGVPVSDPTPAFKTPGQMAAEAGYVGDANAVSSVALDRSGIMTVTANDNTMTEVNFSGVGETLAKWAESHEPDLAVQQRAESLFLTATGSSEQLKLETQMHTGKNGLYAVKVDAKTGMPILVSGLNSEGVREWQVATWRNIGGYEGFNLGVSAAMDEQNWFVAADGSKQYNGAEYDGPYHTVLREFAGAIKLNANSYSLLRDYPDAPGRAVAAIQHANMPLYLADSIFWSLDQDPSFFVNGDRNGALRTDITEAQVRDSMNKRIDSVLAIVKAAGGGRVSLMSEPIYFKNGIEGPVDWNKDVLFQTFGENKFTEAYVTAFERAMAMGLTPGKDVIFEYTDFGIEVDCEKSRFVEQMLLNSRQAIFDRLHSNPAYAQLIRTPEDVRIDVGMEYHIKTDNRDNHNLSGTYLDKLTPEAMEAGFDRFSQFGEVHLVETQVHSQDPKLIVDTMKKIITAAKKSNGEVADMVIYQALRDEAWFSVPHLFFDAKDQPTAAYYELMQELFTD